MQAGTKLLAVVVAVTVTACGGRGDGNPTVDVANPAVLTTDPPVVPDDGTVTLPDGTEEEFTGDGTNPDTWEEPEVPVQYLDPGTIIRGSRCTSRGADPVLTTKWIACKSSSKVDYLQVYSGTGVPTLRLEIPGPGSSHGWGPAAIIGDTLVVGRNWTPAAVGMNPEVQRGDLLAVDLTTGDITAEIEGVGHTVADTANSEASPVWGDVMVGVTADPGELHAVNIHTGETLWTRPVADVDLLQCGPYMRPTSGTEWLHIETGESVQGPDYTRWSETAHHTNTGCVMGIGVADTPMWFPSLTGTPLPIDTKDVLVTPTGFLTTTRPPQGAPRIWKIRSYSPDGAILWEQDSVQPYIALGETHVVAKNESQYYVKWPVAGGPGEAAPQFGPFGVYHNPKYTNGLVVIPADEDEDMVAV